MASNISREGRSCFLHLPDPSFHLVSERYLVNLVTAIINIVSSPFGVVSNLLIMVSILSNSRLRTPSNLFISCLALSDVLVGLSVQPGYIAFRLMENQLRSVPCFVRVAYTNAFYICCGVSFMTLTSISYERFVAVRLHTRYNETFSSRRVLKYVSAIWVFNILLTCLQWAGSGISKISRGTHLLVWFCCLLTAIIANIRIMLFLHRYRHQVRSINVVSQSIQHRRAISRTKTICMIVGVYFLLNVPVLFVTIYHQILEQDIKSYNHYSWAETAAFLNSCTNPLICYWKNRHICQSVKSILRKLSCC
ncbi:adenosine receptor A2b-like [Montipora capricornis]|uniref:adenosine receptor A2b-like n=1 Tax=Montipora capricornis TaxID=246305 RepID=UPI0035F1ACD7